MKKHHYSGSVIEGYPIVTFWTGEVLVDLERNSRKYGLAHSGPIRWGDDSEASRFVAQMILYHACGEFDLADALSTLFVYDCVRLLGQQWELSREWVREWIAKHQRFALIASTYPWEWMNPSRN